MNGHLKDLGDGRWRLTFDLERGADGKRRQKTRTFHASGKRAAEKERTRILAEAQSGQFHEPSRVTVGELLDAWMETVVKPTVSPGTYQHRAQIVRDHLRPRFGGLKLSRLAAVDIQRAWADLLSSGGARGPVSPATLKNIHSVFRQALRQAIDWDLLTKNPADRVKLPRQEQPPPKAITEEEFRRILHACEGSRVYLPVLVAVATGLRRGELAALRWQDLQFHEDGGSVTVRQSFRVDKGTGELLVSQTKSRRERRHSFGPALAAALQEHRREQERQRREFRAVWQEHGLVFPKDDGSPWPPGAIYSMFQHRLKAAGLPLVPLHTLRHSSGTWEIEHGISLPVVSERLGHRSAAFTLGKYLHVLPGKDEEAAAVKDGIIARLLEG
jgi:integrase